MNDQQLIDELAQRTKTVALVGASPKTHRASYGVMQFLQRRGIRVYPVNPRFAGNEILGERVYAQLSELPVKVDFVDVFLNTQAAADIVDQVVELDLDVVWLQLGVLPFEAVTRAQAAGVKVVMDRCPAIEWREHTRV